MDGIIADIFIILSALTLLAAAALTAYSVWRSLRTNKRPERENGVPTRLIGFATVGILLLIALPTLLFGSFTDMCIITAINLLFIATGCVIFGKILTARLRKRV